MKKKFLDTFFNEIENKHRKHNATTIALPMNMISDMIQTSGKYIYEDHGITRSEIDLLATLYFNDGLTAVEVSERMVFTSGGISKVVKKLEFRNLIYKKESSKDKRSFLLYISDQGKSIVEECIPKFAQHENKFFSVLNETEKEILQKALKKILYALTED